jgi:hypothetical protein
MIIVGIFIGIIVIGVVVFFVFNKDDAEKECISGDILGENNNCNSGNNPNPQEENESNNEDGPKPENKPKDEEEGNDDSLISEELKEVFKPVFDINSKVGTLTQTLMESKQNLKIKSIDSTEYTFFKAIFDTYIISENSPEKSQISKLYNKK